MMSFFEKVYRYIFSIVVKKVYYVKGSKIKKGFSIIYVIRI